MSINFSSAHRFRVVATGRASGGTAVNSDAVDMAGYESVTFLARARTGATGNSINVAVATATGASFSDLEGTAVNFATDTNDAWVEVYRPPKRYVRLEVDRSGTNTVLDAAWAIQGGAKDLPASGLNTAAGITGELHASPATGTA